VCYFDEGHLYKFRLVVTYHLTKGRY
jgi:hypothetical protein